MTNTDFTTGDKVQYTNRKGTTMNGVVLEVLPPEMAEVYGEHLVIVEFLDGPAQGVEKRMKPADLVRA